MCVCMYVGKLTSSNLIKIPDTPRLSLSDALVPIEQIGNILDDYKETPAQHVPMERLRKVLSHDLEMV